MAGVVNQHLRSQFSKHSVRIKFKLINYSVEVINKYYSSEKLKNYNFFIITLKYSKK